MFELAGKVLLVELISVVAPYCNLSGMENSMYDFIIIITVCYFDHQE